MLERARQAAAEKLKQAATVTGEQAREAAQATSRAAAAGLEKAAVTARDPATHAKAKVVAKGAAQGAGKAAEGAGRLAKTALDKLNPATLAAIVMKATSIQEQANASLRAHRSLYRIGGIEIGAAFPPSVSFQIVRAAELELEEQLEEQLEVKAEVETESGPVD